MKYGAHIRRKNERIKKQSKRIRVFDASFTVARFVRSLRRAYFAWVAIVNSFVYAPNWHKVFSMHQQIFAFDLFIFLFLSLTCKIAQ